MESNMKVVAFEVLLKIGAWVVTPLFLWALIILGIYSVV